MEKAGARLLIAIDEYEKIDVKIGEHVFSKDILDALRESIQTHRNLTWIFAGSHEITELQHAPWTSYLISARTIEIPMFSFEETHLLLTDPFRYAPAPIKGSPPPPRFTSMFWGSTGIERIHREAGGWPHLVQLVAETAIDLLNRSEQRALDEQLLDEALRKAVVRGHNVFHELLVRECQLPGEWDYVLRFRSRERQPPPEDSAVRAHLRQRLLIEERSGEWQLRVPLMAQWLRDRS
jgi:hypothetical protein